MKLVYFDDFKLGVLKGDNTSSTSRRRCRTSRISARAT